MKITYKENPLRTTIELVEHEKKELWYKIKIEEMIDRLHSAALFMDKEDRYNLYDLDRARREVDPNYYYSEYDSTGEGDKESKLDKRVNELHKHFLEELVLPHCGDCTCVPMSCSKCHAEELLGIHTTKGLGKHEASKIMCAFGSSRESNWEDTRNIHEAIRWLESYEPKADWKGWEAHAERWAREVANALGWLKSYRDEHFS